MLECTENLLEDTEEGTQQPSSDLSMQLPTAPHCSADVRSTADATAQGAGGLYDHLHIIRLQDARREKSRIPAEKSIGQDGAVGGIFGQQSRRRYE